MYIRIFSTAETLVSLVMHVVADARGHQYQGILEADSSIFSSMFFNIFNFEANENRFSISRPEFCLWQCAEGFKNTL